MSTTQSQKKRVVLITGCSSGIGKALAREFYRSGCRVFASARNINSLRELMSEGLDGVQMDVTNNSLRELMSEGLDGVQMDVTNKESVDKALAEVVEKAGRIDILVNNAGVSSYAPAIEAPLDEVRELMETNFFGLVALTQTVITKYMIPARSGTIVQISSIMGEICTPWSSFYAASKAAVTRWSDALRMEVAPFGVNIVIVKPGGVKSEIANSAGPKLNKIAATSVYKAIWNFITMRSNASQHHPMPSEAFASVVAKKVLLPTPPAVIITATNSLKLRVLSFLPNWVTDRIFTKIYGLLKLRSILNSTHKSE